MKLAFGPGTRGTTIPRLFNPVVCVTAAILCVVGAVCCVGFSVFLLVYSPFSLLSTIKME